MMPYITPGAGDEILLPDPSYMGNFTNAALLGGKSVHVPLDTENNYTFDFQALEKAVTDKTKLLVLTNPNNPTGRCYTLEELTRLAEFVERHDLAVVVDQAFEDCVFSGHQMVTFAALPGMYERTTTVFSTSKGMGFCGFRIAYILACPRVSGAMQKAVVAVGGAPNTLAQYGALAAFRDSGFLKNNAAFYEERTARTWEMLRDIPGTKCSMPDAGYFLWMDVSDLGHEREIVSYIAEEANVVISGGAGFGRQGVDHLRIITSAMDDDAKYYDAIARMRKALDKLSKAKYN